MTDDRWDLLAWGGIGAGVVARVVWDLVLHPPVNFVYSDMANYVVDAQHLVRGRGIGRLDAFFPAGTHLVLAIPMVFAGTGRTGLWADAILWCALGSITPWLVWRWARAILSVPAAALTAVGCALWPLLITQPAFFMSEVPALALLMAGLLLAARLRGDAHDPAWYDLLLLGLLAGLGIAVRPQLLLNFAIAIVPVAIGVWRRQLAIAILIGAVAFPIALVAALNTSATGQLTFISENSGVNFFLAHCDGGAVTAAGVDSGFFIRTPVFEQTHRGRSYSFPTHHIWDQGFFVREGLHCISRDGLGHVRLLARHVLDLTVTSVPWPQSDDPAMRRVVGPVNRAYGLALPAIVIAAAMTFLGDGDRNRGERLVLLHLLCLVPTVLVFLSEPRFRVPYDVFGLTLVAALATRAAGLDRDGDSDFSRIGTTTKAAAVYKPPRSGNKLGHGT